MGLSAWSFLTKRDVVTIKDEMNRILWNDKNILGQSKSFMCQLRNCNWKKMTDFRAKLSSAKKNFDHGPMCICGL